MAGPLAPYRVLDLSRVLAAPWVGQTMADLGAEVIKVERPGSGDETRGWGPPFLADRDGEPTGESAYFLSANRGKKSVAVDIGTPEGQQIVRDLAAKSDVLLENYKVGGLAKYGLDYQRLEAVNPGLVYCSITGFGQDGPYAGRAGYDFMIQGMSGLMSVTGEAGGMPMKVGVAVSDLFTGLYATVAILAALSQRERSGAGQHIDMSLLDCQIAALANQTSNFHISGKAPVRMGNAHPNIVPYEAVPTADGHIILAIGNDRQYARFCEVAGRPELVDDARFAGNAGRVANRDVLMPLIHDITRTRAAADWIAALEAVQVPCGPINGLGEVFDDPQVRHRGMRIELDHPLAGTVPLTASPMRFSGTPVEYGRAPPLLGQHTREVVCGLLGRDAAAVEDLMARGICAGTGEAD
ncbi:MAG: CoA transferase [Alphaproteobacteria bacterium]|nr:CoA transferase [Alphaproteobacteria bacterium]